MRGLFVNSIKANCSIYESGLMCYRRISASTKHICDYIEGTQVPNTYDFYIFNYHGVVSPWVLNLLHTLPKVPKFTLVLEMNEGNPYILTPANLFDGYLVLDPTMPETDKVFAFPRPLEIIDTPTYAEPTLPVIGSFGFATGGKYWNLLPEIINKEFEEATLRLNIPASTYADPDGRVGKEIFEYCKSTLKPGIKTEFTQYFMTQEELIRWCAENTLNCFLYYRGMAGLCATTDQAISAGRPLLISNDRSAFRHILSYDITPYPNSGMPRAIKESLPAVLKMREDWSPQKFTDKFDFVLEKYE